MASLEEEIRQSKFENELIKANLNVMFTSNWLYNKITASLKPFNVTHEQYNVLRILKGSHPACMNQKDILSRMLAPNSNITLIVKKLIAKQLIQVVQSPADRREYEISITAAGLTLLQQIEKGMAAQNTYFNALTVSEAFHLNALLDKLRTG